MEPVGVQFTEPLQKGSPTTKTNDNTLILAYKRIELNIEKGEKINILFQRTINVHQGK